MLGLKSCIIDSLGFLGGQCKVLYAQKPIYDIPGFPSIKSEQLINNLVKQAEQFNATQYLNQKCILIIKKGNYWEIVTSKNTICTKSIVIAAGAGRFNPRKPPLNNIKHYEKTSIFYSVQDINLFKNKIVTIAGGGDSALDWAVVLASNITKKVYLVHRRSNFRGAIRTVEKIKSLSKVGAIELITPYSLNKLEGDGRTLKKIEVKNLDNGTLKFESDYLLAFFGNSMDIDPLNKWNLSLKNKYIVVNPESMETNLRGVFAVGDICYYPGKLKLILTGFAECARACHSAYNYINPNVAKHFEHSTNKSLFTNS